MKKTIALLLALLLVAGAVFAEVIEIDRDNETPTPPSTNYTMNLKAVVPEGGGLDDSDGDDPDDIKNGGLYIMVGYNYKNSTGYTMGNDYNTGDLEDLGTYHSNNPLTVSLVPENGEDENGTLQFYVAAKSNSSVAKATTVTFSTEGFKNTNNESAPTIAIGFKDDDALTTKTNGLSASHETVASTEQTALTEEAGASETSFKVSADKGSKQMNYIYVARTDASWLKSASYAAGAYTATITVTVTAAL